MAYGTEQDTESFAFGPAGAIPSTKYQTPAQNTVISKKVMELDKEGKAPDWQRPGFGGYAGEFEAGAVSPGPGADDGLESGVDDLYVGTRTKGDGTTVNMSLGRRQTGPVSTMLQGPRELG